MKVAQYGRVLVDENGNIVGVTSNKLDVSAALIAGTNIVGKVSHDRTGIGHGVKTVTTATIATGSGVILYAGDSITLEIDDLVDVFIDSLVNGEGVRYTYLT